MDSKSGKSEPSKHPIAKMSLQSPNSNSKTETVKLTWTERSFTWFHRGFLSAFCLVLLFAILLTAFVNLHPDLQPPPSEIWRNRPPFNQTVIHLPALRRIRNHTQADVINRGLKTSTFLDQYIFNYPQTSRIRDHIKKATDASWDIVDIAGRIDRKLSDKTLDSIPLLTSAEHEFQRADYFKVAQGFETANSTLDFLHRKCRSAASTLSHYIPDSLQIEKDFICPFVTPCAPSPDRRTTLKNLYTGLNDIWRGTPQWFMPVLEDALSRTTHARLALHNAVYLAKKDWQKDTLSAWECKKAGLGWRRCTRWKIAAMNPESGLFKRMKAFFEDTSIAMDVLDKGRRTIIEVEERPWSMVGTLEERQSNVDRLLVDTKSMMMQAATLIAKPFLVEPDVGNDSIGG